MSSSEPDVAPEGLGSQGAPPASPGAAPAGTGSGLARARALAILGGVLAGLAAFGIGETTAQLIPPESQQFSVSGRARTMLSRDTPRVITRTAALAFGALGLCLGGGLGIAGGLARRSAPAAAAGGLLGMVLGAALGGGVSLGVIPASLEMRRNHQDLDIFIGMLAHGVIWGPLGAAAGLAFAVGLGERRLIGRALMAGLVGAVLGAIAFDIIGSLAFPLAKTDAPISETWPTRLIARLLVAVGTAGAAILLLAEPDPHPLVDLAPAREPES